MHVERTGMHALYAAAARCSGCESRAAERRGKLQIKRTERRGKGPGVGNRRAWSPTSRFLCALESFGWRRTVNAEVIFPSFLE